METMVYEYKLWREGVAWEQVPVHEVRTFHAKDADACQALATRAAVRLSQTYRKEVRFNRHGSQQGHYLGCNLKFEQLYRKPDYR